MIEVRKLVKRFGLKTVLRGLDFQVEPGEFVALLGPNGAGKTTFLRILASLSRPSLGEVRIAGYRLPAEASRRAPAPGSGLSPAAAVRRSDRRGKPALLRPHVRRPRLEPAHQRGAGAGRSGAPPARPGAHLFARHAAAPGDRPGRAARPGGDALRRAAHRAGPGCLLRCWMWSCARWPPAAGRW